MEMEVRGVRGQQICTTILCLIWGSDEESEFDVDACAETDLKVALMNQLFCFYDTIEKTQEEDEDEDGEGREWDGVKT